jgi:hypothetical protein
MINTDYNAYLDAHCHYEDLGIDYLREVLTKNDIYSIGASVDIDSYKKLEKFRLAKINNLYLAYGISPDEITKKPF